MNWFSRAPANLMLLGEHSVVYGQPALACAVNQFMEIEWSAQPDSAQVCINSELAQFECTLEELRAFEKHPQLDHPKLRFVMHALKTFANDLPYGLHITIRSEFSSTLGLGSSAAVLAAMLQGLNLICEKQLSTLELFHKGREIILDIQGRGSGTDLAASLGGGVIQFQPPTESQTADIRPVTQTGLLNTPLTLVYSGYKTPTAEVLEIVAQRWQSQPEILTSLYELMGQTTSQAFTALQNHDLSSFYQLCDTYQGLMDALGVNDVTMSQLVYQLRQQPGIHSCKISGSGLGDCVLGFGEMDSTTHTLFSPDDVFKLQISPTGAESWLAES